MSRYEKLCLEGIGWAILLATPSTVYFIVSMYVESQREQVRTPFGETMQLAFESVSTPFQAIVLIAFFAFAFIGMVGQVRLYHTRPEAFQHTNRPVMYLMTFGFMLAVGIVLAVSITVDMGAPFRVPRPIVVGIFYGSAMWLWSRRIMHATSALAHANQATQ